MLGRARSLKPTAAAWRQISRRGRALVKTGGLNFCSPLPRLEAAVGLVDHVDPGLAAHQAVVAVAPAQRFQRIPDLSRASAAWVLSDFGSGWPLQRQPADDQAVRSHKFGQWARGRDLLPPSTGGAKGSDPVAPIAPFCRASAASRLAVNPRQEAAHDPQDPPPRRPRPPPAGGAGGEPISASRRCRCPSPARAQFLVRVVYLSLDPYMRGRMRDAASYAAPVGIGEVMTGGTVGEVVEIEPPRLQGRRHRRGSARLAGVRRRPGPGAAEDRSVPRRRSPRPTACSACPA